MENLNYDIESEVGQWFECTLPVTLYKDQEGNFNMSQSVASANGYPLPEKIFFNPDNRTLFGVVTNLTVFRFDFTFNDDQSMPTFANIKLTIRPAPIKRSFIMVYIVSASGFFAILVYLSFSFLYSQDITRQPEVHKHEVTQHMMNARERFGEFLDVTVTYKLNARRPAVTRNRPIFNPSMSAVITTDFDFQPDQQLGEDDIQHTQMLDTT